MPRDWRNEDRCNLENRIPSLPLELKQPYRFRTASAFDDAGGKTYGGPKVPVESDAAHWRQSVFGFELMTRSFPGGRLLLGAITIQSLADLGYQVNVSRADECRLPAPASAKPVAEQVLDWGECVPVRPVYVVDGNGRVVDVVGK